MIEKRHLVKKVWPFLLTVMIGIAITWPLWHQGDLIFADRLDGEALTAAWYINWVSHYIFDGHLPPGFLGFDYPCYLDRLTIPDVVDAYLAAPINWVLDWPRAWGAQQAYALVLSALGVSLFAMSLGARHLGIILPGVMYLCLPPLWHELREGYINAAWPGLAFAALAFFIIFARRIAHNEVSTLNLLLWCILSAGFGALALSTYPVYVAALMPVGLALCVEPLKQSPGPVLAWVFSALALGLILSYPHLQAMLSFQAGLYPEWPCSSESVPCSMATDGLYLSTLAVFKPDQLHSVFDVATVASSTWLIAPLGLFFAKHKKRALFILLWIGTLLWISLGPCPQVTVPARVDSPLPFRAVESMFSPIWCLIGKSRVHHRYLMAAAGLALVLGGLGLEQLWRKGKSVKKALSIGIATLAFVQVFWILRANLFETNDGGALVQWDNGGPTVVGNYLKELPPQVVAELPFEYDLYMHSALEAPQHLRLNSFKPDTKTLSNNAFVDWLKDLGNGNGQPGQYSANDVEVSGVNLVFYDKGRCRDGKFPNRQECEEQLLMVLKQALGEGQTLAPGVFVWKIHSREGSAQTLQNQCKGPISILDARGGVKHRGLPLINGQPPGQQGNPPHQPNPGAPPPVQVPPRK